MKERDLTTKEMLVRAIRLELAKPLGESWDEVGPVMRTLLSATPKLLNAAMDARVACAIVGTAAVKDAIASEARAKSADGIAYQAVLRAIENLRAWGKKKGLRAFAELELPGGMASAISRVACQAYARRDQGRQRFASERILVRASETDVASDERGVVLVVKLRSEGTVRFAVSGSKGAHRRKLRDIARRSIEHGDCQIRWDRDRKKWYALVAYKEPLPEPIVADSRRVLVVHRGMRNVLYALTSTGETGTPFRGNKYLGQRRKLRARQWDAQRVTADERGSGAKGHGRERRYEAASQMGDKLARATHTFCLQAAAWVARLAIARGCGIVVIEDYGGIAPASEPAVRRLLDRFPFDQLKQCIVSRLQLATDLGGNRVSITLWEVPAAYISSTCPRCRSCDVGQHNVRTGIFHCKTCVFERPADWVAAFWMLDRSGADMGVLRRRLADELKFLRRKVA